MQMAWRLFGDILEALKKCIPHVKKDLRKGKRMLAWLNSRITQIIKARRQSFKKLNFHSKEENRKDYKL